MPSPATPWRLAVHPDASALPKGDARRPKVEWALLELALRGRTTRVKGTAGQPWRRTPIAGSHWYLTWAPGGAAGLDLPGDRVVWVRALRHHDETSRPLPSGSPDDYVDLPAGDLDPRTDDQRAAETKAPGAVVQIVGPPGSGKTATLLFATRSPSGRALFVTSTEALARDARRFFAAAGAPGVDVLTSRDLVARLAGGSPVQGGDASTFRTFLVATRGPLRPLLGPWLGREAALWAELRGVVAGLPQAFPWKRGAVTVPAGPSLDASTYAAVSDLPDPARAAALAVAAVGLRDGWFADLEDARQAATAVAASLPDWARVDLLSVDEAQDLTPVELGLIIDLARAHPERPPTLYFAGDDSQTLLPTGFDWGAVGDLAHQRLGAHATRSALTSQLRQPRSHAALVARVGSLYRGVDKDLRPHVLRAEDAEDAEGRIVVVETPPPDRLHSLLATQPGQIAVHLLAPPTDSAVAFTPEDVKGLERRTVVLPDFAAHLVHLGRLVEAADRDADPIAGREARREIDRLRVALSRSTNDLVLWGPGTSAALQTLGLGPDRFTLSTETEVARALQAPIEDGAWLRLDEAAELLDRGDSRRAEDALARAQGADDRSLQEELARLRSPSPRRILVPPRGHRSPPRRSRSRGPRRHCRSRGRHLLAPHPLGAERRRPGRPQRDPQERLRPVPPPGHRRTPVPLRAHRGPRRPAAPLGICRLRPSRRPRSPPVHAPRPRRPDARARQRRERLDPRVSP